MNEIEFLPDRIRRQRDRRGRLVRTGYLLAACVLAMIALTVIRHYRIAAARADLASLGERAANVERQVGAIAPLERQMADLLIKKRIDAQLGSRADCTAALAELCRIMPPNLALSTLELETVDVREDPEQTRGAAVHRSARLAVAAGPRRKGRAVRRLRLVITGLAPSDVDVANFIGQLSASCLFEDVNMGYARTVNFHHRTARQFEASCYLMR